MKKIKKALSRLRALARSSRGRKRLAIISVSGLTLSCLLYYSISFLSVSEGEICLERLKRSWAGEQSCHEACALSRVEDKNCVAASLGGASRTERKVKSYLNDEKADLDFRVFILEAVKKRYGSDNPPPYLSEYFSREGGNGSLKLAIFRNFSLAGEGGQGSDPIDYYFSILEGDFPLELKLEAAVKIASQEDLKEHYSANQVAAIEKIVMDKDSDAYFRQSLVLLLGSYREVLPEESDAALARIYSADFPGDNITRAFAADFLGEEMPPVSQEEWKAYYNHK